MENLRFMLGSIDVIKSKSSGKEYSKLCGVLNWRTGTNLEFVRNEPYSFFVEGKMDKLTVGKVYLLDTSLTMKDGELKLYVKGLKA